MSLSQFLNSLLHEGRVRVVPIFDLSGQILIEGPEELAAAAAVLESFECEYRSELAHRPPPLAHAALLWGAQNVQRACSLLTFRDINAEGVRSALNDPCPEPPSHSVVYSVDLTFRFLPDLTRLARAVSPVDPLVGILGDWSRQWPLSSVGVSAVSVIGPLEWLDDPCLRQLYVDRILAEGDESRLDDPRTREAVLEAVGRHPELSPKLAARLFAK